MDDMEKYPGLVMEEDEVLPSHGLEKTLKDVRSQKLRFSIIVGGLVLALLAVVAFGLHGNSPILIIYAGLAVALLVGVLMVFRGFRMESKAEESQLVWLLAALGGCVNIAVLAAAVSQYPVAGGEEASAFVALVFSIGFAFICSLAITLVTSLATALLILPFAKQLGCWILHRPFSNGLLSFFTWGVAFVPMFGNSLTGLPLVVPMITLLGLGLGLTCFGPCTVWTIRAKKQDRDSKVVLSFAVGTILCVGLAVGCIFVVAYEGSSSEVERIAFQSQFVNVSLNPATPGPFASAREAYSGSTVDLSEIARFSAYRETLFGFDATRIPITGRVYTPLGVSNPPLLICAAGNHQITVKSAFGYEYLCEHLATQGIACATADMDFFNDLLFGLLRADSLQTENDILGRAVFYLEHAKHLVSSYGFDETRIALLGHSRSGESVAVSQWLVHGLSENASVPEYEGYDIASVRTAGIEIPAVIALAPTTASYKPEGVSVFVTNASYLTIQGSNDFDQDQNFDGLQEYTNAKPGKGDIAAAVYVQGANHARFNTAWGEVDMGPILAWFVNRAVLIQSEEQRTIAKASVTALLRDTFFSDYAAQSVDRQLFADHRTMIGSVLPSTTNYQLLFKSPESSQVLLDFEDVPSLLQCGDNITCSATGWNVAELKNRFERCCKLIAGDTALLLTGTGTWTVDFSTSKMPEVGPNSTILLDIGLDVESSLPRCAETTTVEFVLNNTGLLPPINCEGNLAIGPNIVGAVFKLGSVGSRAVPMLNTFAFQLPPQLSQDYLVSMTLTVTDRCSIWVDNLVVQNE